MCPSTPSRLAFSCSSAASRLVQPVCDYADYCFDSEDDKAVALAARLSILTRKDLDVAPAFLLVGPERGTGKTTLAAIDHVIATGYDIPVAELEKEPDKAKQTLFSVFNSSPAAVLFDNLPANSAFGSLALTKSLTKSEFGGSGFLHTDRGAGEHQRAGVPHRQRHRARRRPAVAHIGDPLLAGTPEHRWSHPDWLAHARGVREDYRTRSCSSFSAPTSGTATAPPGWSCASPPGRSASATRCSGLDCRTSASASWISSRRPQQGDRRCHRGGVG